MIIKVLIAALIALAIIAIGRQKPPQAF